MDFVPVCSAFLLVTCLSLIPHDASAQGRPPCRPLPGPKRGGVHRLPQPDEQRHGTRVAGVAHGAKGRKLLRLSSCREGGPDAFEHNGFLIPSSSPQRTAAAATRSRSTSRREAITPRAARSLAPSTITWRGRGRTSPWPPDACSATDRGQVLRVGKIRSGHLAPKRDRPDQSRRNLGELYGVPYAPQILRGEARRPTPAASATSGRTIRRWKCTRSPSTGSCTRPSGTS